MKKYLSYVVCLAALLFSSCIKDNIVDNPSRDVVLSFTISNGDTRANGDGASIGTNDDLYNEDAIKNVDIFLYPATATDAAPATKHLALSFEDTREQCTIQETLSNNELVALGLNANGAKCKAYIVVNYPEVATQVASTSVADLQATVVNTDFSQTQPYDTKMVGSDPTSTIKLTSVKPQDKFVMDSEVVELSFDNANKVLGSTTSIPVTRVAAKIRLTVSLADKIFTGNQGTGGLIWFPNVEGMNVAFYNGVKSATVHKIEDPEDRTDENNKADFFNVEGIQFLTTDLMGGTGAGFVGGDSAEGSAYVPTRAAVSDVTHVTPFYTYPSAWKTDLDINDAARFELVVRWYSVPNSDEYYDENGEFQDPGYIGDPSTAVAYHYSIPINMVEKKIERNKYYNIKLNIGVLGNLDTFDPSVYSYTVDDWYSEDINVQLTKPQYLTVEENYVEIYNQNSYGVGYKASDDITAVITEVVKPNYTDENAIENNVVYESTTGSTSVTPPKFTVNRVQFGNQNPISVSVVDGQIVLTHILNNDMSSNDLDYVPYTVTVLVTMKLANGQSITEEIVFKQYPAIYLFADQNTDFDNGGTVNSDHNTLVNGYYGGGSSTTSVSGATFVGPVSDERSQVGYYGSVTGLTSSANNQNPNQYVITVSSISADQNYVIGDPRVRTSDTELVNATNRVQTGGNYWNPTYTEYPAWATGYVVDENMNSVTPNRKLAHYYPTNVEMVSGKTDKTKPENFLTGWTIAPKFRIASSYAVVYSIDMMEEYDNAKKRCASYQENGYPAGRWRMPTYAEVAFIASMSDRLMIPRLFNDNTNYWCAHGNFMPDGGEVELTNSSSATSIRCVYDEWYWGNEKLANPSQFTWGDTEITW